MNNKDLYKDNYKRKEVDIINNQAVINYLYGQKKIKTS